MGGSHPEPFEAWSAGASVAVDCVCAGCGYNLRGQVIRREPFTQLWVARCPECGCFTPAEYLYLAGRARLGLLAIYVIGLGAGFALLVMLVISPVAVGLEIVADVPRGPMGYQHVYAVDGPAEWLGLALAVFNGIAGGYCLDGLMALLRPKWRPRVRLGVLFVWSSAVLLASGLAVWLHLRPDEEGYWLFAQRMGAAGMLALMVGGSLGARSNGKHVRLLEHLASPVRRALSMLVPDVHRPRRDGDRSGSSGPA